MQCWRIPPKSMGSSGLHFIPADTALSVILLNCIRSVTGS